MKKIFIFLFCAAAIACATTYNIQLTNFDSGETIHGTAVSGGNKVSVVMPNGEVLRGEYITTSDASFKHTNLIVTQQGVIPVYGVTRSQTGNGYVLLKSNKSKLIMEIVVRYDGHHGIGEARTNDGRVYRVQVDHLPACDSYRRIHINIDAS